MSKTQASKVYCLAHFLHQKTFIEMNYNSFINDTGIGALAHAITGTELLLKSEDNYSKRQILEKRAKRLSTLAEVKASEWIAKTDARLREYSPYKPLNTEGWIDRAKHNAQVFWRDTRPEIVASLVEYWLPESEKVKPPTAAELLQQALKQAAIEAKQSTN